MIVRFTESTSDPEPLSNESLSSEDTKPVAV
jgi:hypothetical protein